MSHEVAVIGAGYVGLTTAACLASLGHDVTCADIDEARVAGLTSGEVPIVEPGLEVLVREGLRAGHLRFVVGAAAAVPEAGFVYLCLPTPQGVDGAADLSAVESVAHEVSDLLRRRAIVINKSTVPVGSTLRVARWIGRSDVAVVSNPEFLREGSAVDDFLHPDRIVIGAEDHDVAVRVAELYLSVPAPLMVTDPASAETIKYVSNAFLATKVSFVNSVAALCESMGADVADVMLGMGYDRRIGAEFLRPGPGFGGSCFPKDVLALLRQSDDAGYDFELLRDVMRVNSDQFGRVADKLRRLAGGSLEGATVAAWGLTFKANTDDLRDSPALEVLRRVVEAGARVRAYDPAVPAGRELLHGVEVVEDPYAACEGADVLAVLTEWDEYRWLDLDKAAAAMAQRAVVDARNLLDRAALARLGFRYEGIGRL